MRPGGTEEQKYFNPRSPHGERRHERRRRPTRTLNFNPRSPHGERQIRQPPRSGQGSISTHAPRTGSDAGSSGRVVAGGHISTHAPRTGSDIRRMVRDGEYTEFQPTLPARGATEIRPPALPTQDNFNPRSPHGERPYLQYGRSGETADFNPRSPHGERRFAEVFAPSFGIISTHAPRTGSDPENRWGFAPLSGFQPTLPARGATSRFLRGVRHKLFQPTLPARGAT